MNAFISAISREQYANGLTANGAVTYTSTGNANLDLFSLAGSMRNKLDQVAELFVRAFNEDPILALKNIFYLRDVRGGLGERDIFKTCMGILICSNYENISTHVLKLIPEYGRWDDLIELLACDNARVNFMIGSILLEQLDADIASMKSNKPCSLLAKWLPTTNNTKNPFKKKIAVKVRNLLNISPRQLRIILSDLRKHLNVVEQKISAKEYSNIDYSTIPSKAGLLYRKAFKRNDEGRYEDFLASLKRGEVSIKTGTLYPYELVHKIFSASSYNRPENDETVELMWKNLPNYCTDNKKAMCVVDTSGSMTGCYSSDVAPIDVALSLGLYFAERNDGPFKNHFITFSTNPSLVAVKGNTLSEKLSNMSRAEWYGSTDIQKTFELILTTAVKNNLSQEDMPSTLYIISDMEFNYCGRNTNLDQIKKKFKAAGYKLPNLVFWNVNGRIGNSPATQYDENTTLVSGCSPSIFKYAVTNQSPIDFMLEVLNSERYEKVTF